MPMSLPKHEYEYYVPEENMEYEYEPDDFNEYKVNEQNNCHDVVSDNLPELDP